MKDHDPLFEVMKATPPIGVAGLTLSGITLQDWALILTIIYLLFILLDKLPVVITRLHQFWRFIRRIKK